MEIKKVLSDKSGRRKTKLLYEKAFPESKKLPWSALLMLAVRDHTDFLNFYHEGIYCGFCFLYHYENMTMILFHAVDKNLRSRGFGTQMLEYIMHENPDDCIVTGVGTVSDKYPDYGQRQKRRHFYFKNGFHDADTKLFLFDEWFDVLYYGDKFSKEEYKRLFKIFSAGILKGKIK
ncbi:MAG: GNAT family N-acetyltransferase [Acutalibacteraceae bacterium]